MGQGAVLHLGDDVFGDRVVTVVGLGAQHRFGRVGEDRVVAVGVEQFALPGGGGGAEALDEAHDQPGADPLAAGPGAERGERDLGHGGGGDPPAAAAEVLRPTTRCFLPKSSRQS